MDHGSQYTADDFLNQVRFWGVTPSFASCRATNEWRRRALQPDTEEQAIHGRVFRNLEKVRAAVVEFKDRYNRTGVSKKLGFMSPHEARQAATLKEAPELQNRVQTIRAGTRSAARSAPQSSFNKMIGF